MFTDLIATVAYSDLTFFWLTVASVFFILILVFGVGIWFSRQKDSLSPYTGHPLRRGSHLSYFNVESVLRFLYDMHQYDNRLIDLKQAAVCRETGRIFPDALTWYDVIRVDWRFLQKRYPGNYVSWGSLSDSQKESIRSSHHTLEGFQTEDSSQIASPRLIEPEYAYMKPGPLYVDMQTKVLLGWKNVPRTNLEVLIVQRPKGIFEVQR